MATLLLYTSQVAENLGAHSSRNETLRHEGRHRQEQQPTQSTG